MSGWNKLPGNTAAINRVIGRYKQRAKRSNKDFNLTREQFIDLTQKKCNYCGVLPSNKLEHRDMHTKRNKGKIYYYGEPFIYNGLDREDNSKGYILDNVVPCCKNCNFAKAKMTTEEFSNWLNQITLFRYKQQYKKNKNCKKILFTGTHGVGKSTASLVLAAKLKMNYRHKNIGTISENVREISSWLDGEINTEKFQKLAILDYFYKENKKQEIYDILICDRTAFDIMIYGEFFNVKINEMYKNMALQNLETFDKIFFIRPDNDHKIINDGFRMTNIKDMLEIDKLFKKKLENYKDITEEIFSKNVTNIDLKL